VSLDVQVEHRYRVTCTDCDYGYVADTARQAEKSAIDHVNEDIGADDPCPHYDHTVTISLVTLVGRNL
jgi:hypothetical protein